MLAPASRALIDQLHHTKREAGWTWEENTPEVSPVITLVRQARPENLMARERAVAARCRSHTPHRHPLSAVAALLVYPPRSGSASSSRLPAEEAMRAIAAGPLRQPWPEGERLAKNLLAPSAVRSCSARAVRCSVLAKLPSPGGPSD